MSKFSLANASAGTKRSAGGEASGATSKIPKISMLTKEPAREITQRVTTSGPGSHQVEEVELSQIWITVTNLHDVDNTAEIIKSLMEKFHKNKDYSITRGTR